MKVSSLFKVGGSQLARSICMSAVLVLFAGAAAAQNSSSLEDLEKQLEEQKIALEEAIANREATAAKASEVKNEREQSEERKRKIEAELKALCEEQESLQEGSFDKCMSSSDS